MNISRNRWARGSFLFVFRNSCFLQKFDFYNLIPYSSLIFHIVLKDRKTYIGGIPEINIQTKMPWERSSTLQHGAILCRKSLNNKIHNASTHLKLSNKLQQWASVAEVYFQGRGLQDSEGLHPGRVRNFAGIKIQMCIFMSVAKGWTYWNCTQNSGNTFYSEFHHLFLVLICSLLLE